MPRFRAQLAAVVFLLALIALARVFSAPHLSAPPPPPPPPPPPIECLLQPVPFRTAYADVAARFAPCVRHWRAALGVPRGAWPGVPLDSLNLPIHAHPDDSLLLHRLWPLALGGVPPGDAAPCGALVVGDDAAALTRFVAALPRERRARRACAPTTVVAISGDARFPAPNASRGRDGDALPRGVVAFAHNPATLGPRALPLGVYGAENLFRRIEWLEALATRADARADRRPRLLFCGALRTAYPRAFETTCPRPARRRGHGGGAGQYVFDACGSAGEHRARVLAAVGFDCGVRRGARLETPAYARALLESKFVLSPRGHGGEPPYRTWEALLLGAVPIVAWDPRHEPLYARLPVVRVRDEEWASVTPAFLRARWAEIERDTERGAYDLRKLYAPYWMAALAASRWAPPARRGGLAAALALVDREPPPNASLAGGATWGA